MKPLISETKDTDSLQRLGRASLQIIHDLRNHLNGLKLYATFLRKRFEKGNRPTDEQETINKLIAGLDLAASDLSALGQFANEIELRKQAVDLQEVLREVVSTLTNATQVTGPLVDSIVIIEADTAALPGDFDPIALAEALKSITLGAVKFRRNSKSEGTLTIRLRRETFETHTAAVVEWQGLKSLDHDPFRSFAGSDEIRMSVAEKIVDAHGGTAEQVGETLRVMLPLTDSSQQSK